MSIKPQQGGPETRFVVVVLATTLLSGLDSKRLIQMKKIMVVIGLVLASTMLMSEAKAFPPDPGPPYLTQQSALAALLSLHVGPQCGVSDPLECPILAQQTQWLGEGAEPIVGTPTLEDWVDNGYGLWACGFCQQHGTYFAETACNDCMWYIFYLLLLSAF